jgi:phenylalanyl-tRNA synthetase alpha chain
VYTVPKLEDFSEESLDRFVEKVKDALISEGTSVTEGPDPLAVKEALLKAFRDRWLARKNGIVTQIREQLKSTPPEHRRAFGLSVNAIIRLAESAVMSADQRIHGQQGDTTAGDRIDITLPGIRRPLGAEHPVIKTLNEMVNIFRGMGYSVAEGPEIESDYYNFESMNFPPNHPARELQDTLFIAGQESKPQRERLLLRTHTSPVQTRTMETQRPPVRVVAPGKVHRHDTPDATHSTIFHQIEGLAVDTNITFCDLKGTLDHAMKAFFGSSVKTRFFPSFFPFTEPSADVQISCPFCGGKGQRDGAACRNCKQSGWIEVLGCGMVDPNVFEFVKDNGYDSRKISGFAFGMGVERIALLKYEIDDIQLFFSGDVRFLEQFA